MSWFKKHLNWTWVLAWLATSIGANIFLNISAGLNNNYIIVLLIIIIGYYGTTLWVLGEKGRSLIWTLFPISALLLENKRRATDETL